MPPCFRCCSSASSVATDTSFWLSSNIVRPSNSNRICLLATSTVTSCQAPSATNPPVGMSIIRDSVPSKWLANFKCPESMPKPRKRSDSPGELHNSNPSAAIVEKLRETLSDSGDVRVIVDPVRFSLMGIRGGGTTRKLLPRKLGVEYLVVAGKLKDRYISYIYNFQMGIFIFIKLLVEVILEKLHLLLLLLISLLDFIDHKNRLTFIILLNLTYIVILFLVFQFIFYIFLEENSTNCKQFYFII